MLIKHDIRRVDIIMHKAKRLEGIKHLHSLGLVHNDINPSNIMLDEHGIPVIIASKASRSFFSKTRSFAGSCHTSVCPTPLFSNDSPVFYLFHEEDRLQEC
jgi:serine/threonine protein kinase